MGVPTAHPVVANSLSRMLAARDWSDADLAHRAQLSRARVNRLKNGRARPTVADALRIAAALDLPVASVFRLDTERRRPRPWPAGTAS